MISEYNILNNIDDLYYLIIDEDGNIEIYSSAKALEIYRRILSNSLSIKSKNEDTEYYLRDTKEWYECVEKSIGVNTLKIFKNITKFKTREKSLQIDQTTGLPNKELTDTLLNECIETAIENKEEFTVIFCDIDFFKNVNDIYGHECGDLILNSLGDLLKSETRQFNHPDFPIRPLDITGRHGGEEFLIVLRNTDSNSALIKADKIRKKVENLENNYEVHKVNITITMGMYHISEEELEKIIDIDEYRSLIMRKADMALYDGKKTGRNKVVIYNDEIKKKNKSKIKNI